MLLIKKLLSYFIEIPVEKTGSNYNPVLEVVLFNGRYKLNASTVTYSYEDRYSSFRRAFASVRVEEQAIGKTLVLGWGLGSIAAIFERIYKNRAICYTAVEIDAAVISLYKKYGYILPAERLTLVSDDALSFVEHCRESFDLICIDLFLDAEVPDKFHSEKFLNHLKKLLSVNGTLLFSWLCYSESLQKKAEHFYRDNFKKTFPTGSIKKLNGNCMMVHQAV